MVDHHPSQLYQKLPSRLLGDQYEVSGQGGVDGEETIRSHGATQVFPLGSVPMQDGKETRRRSLQR